MPPKPYNIHSPGGVGSTGVGALATRTEEASANISSVNAGIVERLKSSNAPTRQKHVTYTLPQAERFKALSQRIGPHAPVPFSDIDHFFSANPRAGWGTMGPVHGASYPPRWSPSNKISAFLQEQGLKRYKDAKNDDEKTSVIRDAFNRMAHHHNIIRSNEEMKAHPTYDFLKKALEMATYQDALPTKQKMTSEELDSLYDLSDKDLVSYVDHPTKLFNKAASHPDLDTNHDIPLNALQTLLTGTHAEQPSHTLIQPHVQAAQALKNRPLTNAEKEMVNLHEKKDLSMEEKHQLAEYAEKNPEIPALQNRVLSEYLDRSRSLPNPERLDYTTSESFSPIAYQGPRIAPFDPQTLLAHEKMVEGKGDVKSLAAQQEAFGTTQKTNIKELEKFLTDERTGKKNPQGIFESYKSPMEGKPLDQQPIPLEHGKERFLGNYRTHPMFTAAMADARAELERYRKDATEEFKQKFLPQIAKNYYRMGAYDSPQKRAAERMAIDKFQKNLDENSLNYFNTVARDTERLIHSKYQAQAQLSQQNQQAHEKYREHQMLVHDVAQKAEADERKHKASEVDLQNLGAKAPIDALANAAQTLSQVGSQRQTQAQNELNADQQHHHEATHGPVTMLNTMAATNAQTPTQSMGFQATPMVQPLPVNQALMTGGTNVNLANTVLSYLNPQQQQQQQLYPGQRQFAGGGQVSSTPHYASYMDQLRAYKKAADFYGQQVPSASNPWIQGVGDMGKAMIEMAWRGKDGRNPGAIWAEGVGKANERHAEARKEREEHRFRTMSLHDHLTDRFGDMFKNVETSQKGRDENEETRRHHVADEGLTARQLTELARHNLAGEGLTGRQLTELERHNLAGDDYNKNYLEEVMRHNKKAEEAALAKASAPKPMSDKDKKELLDDFNANFKVMGINAAGHAIAPFMPNPETSGNKTWHSLTSLLGTSPSYGQLAHIDALGEELVGAMMKTESAKSQGIAGTQTRLRQTKFGKEKDASTNKDATLRGFQSAEHNIKVMIPRLKRAGYSEDEIKEMIKDGYELAKNTAASSVEGYEKLSKFNNKEKASWEKHLEKADDLWKNSKFAKMEDLFQDAAPAENSHPQAEAYAYMSAGNPGPLTDIFRSRIIDSLQQYPQRKG